MALSSTQSPRYHGVLTPNVIGSLLPKNSDDPLQEQRQVALNVLSDAIEKIEHPYHRTGKIDLAETAGHIATFAINRHDLTSLTPQRNETPEYMERMVRKALGPIRNDKHLDEYMSRAVCSYQDKIRMVLDLFKDHPRLKVAQVSGAFPAFFLSADDVWRDLDAKAKMLQDLPNEKEYDSVLAYIPFMNGDLDTVKEILKAEADACKEFGFAYKCIQKVSVHAYGARNTLFGQDYFRSVYQSSTMAMEAGAICVKTSTGMGAMAPFDHFVSKDDGYLAKSIGMLLAIRDFNAENGTKCWPKFSGGNENVADMAMLYYATKEICGDEIADIMCMGAGYALKDELLRIIHREEGPTSVLQYGDYASDQLAKVKTLPVSVTGKPPRKGQAAPETPAQLAQFSVELGHKPHLSQLEA